MNIKWIQSLFILIMIAQSICSAASPSEAERLYNEGKYEESAVVYTSLIESHGENASLWYNLGNAYLKSDAIGNAIFAYRKSAKLNGYDSDLFQNLQFARKKVIHSVAPSDSFLSFLQTKLSTLSISTWFWIANMTLLCILAGLFLRKQPQIVLPRFFNHFIQAISVVTVMSWIIFWGCFYYQIHLQNSVVVAKKSAIKSGPANTLPTLFYLHEGVELTVIKQTSDWAEIKLDNGLQGWVYLADISLI